MESTASLFRNRAGSGAGHSRENVIPAQGRENHASPFGRVSGCMDVGNSTLVTQRAREFFPPTIYETGHAAMMTNGVTGRYQDWYYTPETSQTSGSLKGANHHRREKVGDETFPRFRKMIF